MIVMQAVEVPERLLTMMLLSGGNPIILIDYVFWRLVWIVAIQEVAGSLASFGLMVRGWVVIEEPRKEFIPAVFVNYITLRSHQV